MRIALVAPLVTPIAEPQVGGAQAFVADLARGLTGRGHHVDVYAASGSAINDANVIDLDIDSRTLTPALYRAAGDTPAGDEVTEPALATVYARVRQIPYDIVHNHGFDPPAVRLATVLDCPVVHTLHLPPTRGMVGALRDAEAGSNPPTVVTVSESCARAWRALVPVDVVLRSHVPTGRIPWSEEPGEGVVFAGRLSPEKGVVQAIQIAREASLHIDVYGDPYDPLYARTAIDPWRRRRGVAIHKALPRADLWERIRRARVVLCPAMWDEPFGMLAAEAQACGTPVVASPRGGLPENIEDGVSGFLVDPTDIAGAANAVRRAGTLSRASCRRHAEVDLDIESSLDAHEGMYQTMLIEPDKRAYA